MAKRLGAAFVEGDDLQDQSRPWFANTLTVCWRIAEAVRANGGPAVVAYPLRYREWFWFRRTLAAPDVRTLFITLTACPAALQAADRGRTLSHEEMARSLEMSRQGYGRRAFADLMLATDAAGVGATLDLLEAWVRERMVSADGFEPPTYSV